MPQRFLRPGITDSEKWNAISFEAQSLWTRLLTCVDDYGRFDGRPSVICGRCYAVWNELHPEDVVTPQRIAALSCALSTSGLAEFYEIEGKKVVQLLTWQERARGPSKWPERNGSVPLRNPAESCGILPPSPQPQPSPQPSPSPDALRNPAEVPTLEQVMDYGSGHAVSPDSCKAFFNYYQGNNLWLNKHDRPIDWRHKLVSWGVKDRNDAAEAKQEDMNSSEFCIIADRKFKWSVGPQRSQFKGENAEANFSAFRDCFEKMLSERNGGKVHA